MKYSLTEIETFLTVMELGTLTAAAARLNLSKSVISKRISDFEAAIGAALFRRNAGRILPTDAAERLAGNLRPALAALKAAAEGAAWGMDAQAPLLGTLAVTAPMSFGIRHLTPIIARFAKRHPELTMQLDYDDRMRDLAREGFDIGIRIGDGRSAALMQRKLCEDRMIACASPDYLRRYGAPLDPGMLRAHAVIGYNYLSDAELWQFRRDGKPVPAYVEGRLTVNNGEAMRDMAIEGLGLAMLPGFLAAEPLAAGRLRPVLTDYQTRVLPIVAVWPPITPVPAKLRVFIDHLVDELRDGKPWDGQDE